jgi:hypothetical protein
MFDGVFLRFILENGKINKINKAPPILITPPNLLGHARKIA